MSVLCPPPLPDLDFEIDVVSSGSWLNLELARRIKAAYQVDQVTSFVQLLPVHSTSLSENHDRDNQGARC